METYDAVIIGAGAMGSAAACFLARRHSRVLLLEQFDFGHARGSSHGESRIFRFAYQQPGYTRLAQAALPLWRDLERGTGGPLLITTGGIDFADDPRGAAALTGVAASLAACGAAFEELDGNGMSRRFPQFRLPREARAVFSPDSGVLLADRAVAVLRHSAARSGAILRDRTPVTAIARDGSAIHIRTSTGNVAAGQVIITAGAWVNELLAPLHCALPIRIEREQVVYFEQAAGGAFDAPGCPVWIHYRDQVAYGIPDLGNGVKAGFHHSGHFGPPGDAGQPDAVDLRRIEEYARGYLAHVDPTPRRPLSCLYTTAHGDEFILGRLSGNESLIIASPCSGHGFKFAVAIGKALADLVIDGETDLPIGHLAAPDTPSRAKERIT